MPIDLRAHGLRAAAFELITVGEGDLVGDLVARFAETAGKPLVAVAIEDADEDLDLAVVAEVVLRPRYHVHFHRRQTIGVTVSYAGRTPIERLFRPNKRLKRVFDWAVGPEGFNFDPLDAAQLVLATTGNPPERVDVELHVGDLAGPDDRLAFSLVPKSFFQG
jgi:hypothetical protein